MPSWNLPSVVSFGPTSTFLRSGSSVSNRFGLIYHLTSRHQLAWSIVFDGLVCLVSFEIVSGFRGALGLAPVYAFWSLLLTSLGRLKFGQRDISVRKYFL